MGDYYITFYDHDTARAHIEIMREDADSPYVKGDWADSALPPYPELDQEFLNRIPPFLRVIWQGIDQERRVNEAYWKVVQGMTLEEQL